MRFLNVFQIIFILNFSTEKNQIHPNVVKIMLFRVLAKLRLNRIVRENFILFFRTCDPTPPFPQVTNYHKIDIPND